MTTNSIVIDGVALLGVNLLVWSFVEWWIHRALMHRRSLPVWLYRALPYFDATHRNHAVLHHQVYYKRYDHEPDDHGRELNLRFRVSDNLAANLFLAPVHAIYLSTNALGSIVLALMITGYMFTWNALHTEMHIPSNRWYFRHRVFRFLNRHHYLHHAHPGRNFNVVLPLADYVMGTAVRPTADECVRMEAEGLYSDRRGTPRPPEARPAPPPRLLASSSRSAR